MAISYLSTEQQGYHKPSGNLLDAATGAMALWNLPEVMKQQMLRQKLANQQAQQNIGIQKSDFDWEQGKRMGPANSLLNVGYDPNAIPQGQVTGAPPDDGIGSTRANTYGVHSRSDIQGQSPPPQNTNQSSIGNNDTNISGTSAQDHIGRINPLNTSAFSDSHATTLSNSATNFGPSSSTNGMNNRGNPNPSPGAGDIHTPFPSTSSKEVTPPNGNSLPRDDSGENSATSPNPGDGSGKEYLLTDEDNPAFQDPFKWTKKTYNEGGSAPLVAGGALFDSGKNIANTYKLAGQGIASLLTSPLKDSMEAARKGWEEINGRTNASPDFENGVIPQSAIGSVIQNPVQGTPQANPGIAPSNGVGTAPSTPIAPNPPSQQEAINQPYQPSQMAQSAIGQIVQSPQQSQENQTPSLWRDLPQWRRDQLIQQMPQIAAQLPQMYDQQALAQSGNALLAPNSPEAARMSAMYGMPVSRGSTVDMGNIASGQGQAMRGMMSGQGTNGAFTIRPDPITGNPTWVAIPEGNQTGPTNHPKYEEGLVKSAREEYNKSHEAEAFDVTRTAWSQLASVAKDAVSNPNPSKDLALMKTFAKIDNPTRGITESNIETEMKNPGYFPGEFQLFWNKVSGGGMLTPQQRQNVIEAAKDSYKGNVNSILQYQHQTVLPQLQSALPNWHPQDLHKALFGQPPDMPVNPFDGQGSNKIDQAKQWLQSNPNDPRAAAVAQKIQQAGG